MCSLPNAPITSILGNYCAHVLLLAFAMGNRIRFPYCLVQGTHLHEAPSHALIKFLQILDVPSSHIPDRLRVK